MLWPVDDIICLYDQNSLPRDSALAELVEGHREAHAAET